MSTRKVYIAIGIDHDNDVVCTDIAESTPASAIDSIDGAFSSVKVLKVLELTVPAKHTVENPPVVKLDLTK